MPIKISLKPILSDMPCGSENEKGKLRKTAFFAFGTGVVNFDPLPFFNALSQTAEFEPKLKLEV